MPYRWKSRSEVDETIVVILNVLDKNPELPGWLAGTINGAIADSDPALAEYFSEQVHSWAPATEGDFAEALAMPHGWNGNRDVDQTIVVIRNCLDRGPELPGWLVGTINRTITESDPSMANYFFAELKKYAPGAMKYFEEGVTGV